MNGIPYFCAVCRLVFIFILLASSFAVFAQIDTDRPAYTNSVNVVPKNALQIEGGLGYNVQVNTLIPVANTALYLKRLETFSAPQTVFRYGISNQTEIRCEMPQFIFSRVKFSNDSMSRYTREPWNRQVGIGLKHKILATDRFTLSSLTTLRSQRDFFSESERELTFGLYNDLIWEYRLNDKSKIAGTCGFGNPKDSHYLNGAILFGSKINDRLWLQAEAVSESYHFENSRHNVFFRTLNISSQYVLSKRDAIDITFGSLLSSSLSSPKNLITQVGYAHFFNSNHE